MTNISPGRMRDSVLRTAKIPMTMKRIPRINSKLSPITELTARSAPARRNITGVNRILATAKRRTPRCAADKVRYLKIWDLE